MTEPTEPLVSPSGVIVNPLFTETIRYVMPEQAQPYVVAEKYVQVLETTPNAIQLPGLGEVWWQPIGYQLTAYERAHLVTEAEFNAAVIRAGQEREAALSLVREQLGNAGLTEESVRILLEGR